MLPDGDLVSKTVNFKFLKIEFLELRSYAVYLKTPGIFFLPSPDREVLSVVVIEFPQESASPSVCRGEDRFARSRIEIRQVPLGYNILCKQRLELKAFVPRVLTGKSVEREIRVQCI
jgi:hypothetical protein